MYIPWLVLLAALVAWCWQIAIKDKLIADAERECSEGYKRHQEELNDFEENATVLLEILAKKMREGGCTDAAREIERFIGNIDICRVLTPPSKRTNV